MIESEAWPCGHRPKTTYMSPKLYSELPKVVRTRSDRIRVVCNHNGRGECIVMHDVEAKNKMNREREGN
jgi:hypothetical protein